MSFADAFSGVEFWRIWVLERTKFDELPPIGSVLDGDRVASSIATARIKDSVIRLDAKIPNRALDLGVGQASGADARDEDAENVLIADENIALCAAPDATAPVLARRARAAVQQSRMDECGDLA